MTKGDGSNEGDNSEFKLPTTWRLILGFLPVDVEALIEFLRRIRREGSETSWNTLYRRAASFGISVTTIGGIVVAVILLVEGADLSDVPIDFTLPYIVIGGIVLVVIAAQWFIKLMQDINEARSPIAEGFGNEAAIFLEMFFGIAMLVIFAIFTLQSFNPLDMVVLAAIGGGLMGLLITGVALILSSATRFLNLIRGRQKTRTTSLDDFAEGRE